MLLISFHIMSFIIFRSFSYSYHLFLCFMLAYTLEVDTGNGPEGAVIIIRDNDLYKGLKALLSLHETMTSIRARGQ